ncbi:MAG TPA: TonB-dependent receptor plug domain-containing protein, partial [Bacteroidales bacterium]|nr:TonB-dependent receptor plug domain-containing protein [Bacteroidales bacterium]
MKNFLFALFALFFFGILEAQTYERFQVIDQSTNSPIDRLNYQAEQTQGITNEEGWINLGYEIPDTLILSHVSYGTWILHGKELERTIKDGVLYRESQTVNLYPVQIIAIHQKQTQPGMIDLDYEEHMTHDGGALLLQDPTISAIRKSAGYGFDPVIRGFKYDQVNIVMNGSQGATAACPNRMDPPTSQMAPNMIDRVEILKGPHALRYGNAVGATINYITGQPEFPENRHPYGRISGGYDGNGNVLKSEALLGMRGNKADIGLFGSWSQGDDYTDGNGNTVQAGFSRLSVGINGGFKIGDRQQLKVSVSNNRAKDAEFAALPMDLRSDNTLMMNARHDVVFRNRALSSINTTVFGSLVDHEMDNLGKNLDPRTLNAVTLASTFNAGARTESSWNFEQTSLFAGIDFRTEGAQGERSREFLLGPMAGNTATDNVWQDSRIDKTGLFSEFHYTTGTTQLVFSARLNMNHAQALDADNKFLEVNDAVNVTQINPGFSIGGKKQIGSDFTAGLWMGRVQRSGSLTEKFINYFPVGLDPF